MVTVQVSGFLTDFTGGARAVTLDGAPPTVAAVLAQLWRRHAALRDRVVNERDEVRPHVGIFVNGDHIRHRDGLQTPVGPNDEVTILPAISGGERGVTSAGETGASSDAGRARTTRRWPR